MLLNNAVNVYRDYYHAKQHLSGLEAIDYFLAERIVGGYTTNLTLNEQETKLLFHLLIALSESQRNGHSCLDLEQIYNQTLFTSLKDGKSENINGLDNQQEQTGYTFASNVQIDDLLKKITFDKNNNSSNQSSGNASNLIVHEYGQLYLRRYWQFECQLADFIKAKLAQQTSVDVSQCRDIIDALFPNTEIEQGQQDKTINQPHPDWQKLSVANSLNKTFSIIAGGPGTGKTYTVTKLLAGLLMNNCELHIEMVAPTGKAAQRLSESITEAVAKFAEQGTISADILARIPDQASTIHRMLGVIPNSPNFRHDETNPISADVLLIDEVSMVDLAMMTRIFRALPAHCQLIMLGDADQLPSVATGSVLADLAPLKTTHYSERNCQFLGQVCNYLETELTPKVDTETLVDANSFDSFYNKGSFDYLTYLTFSRRFSGDGGIGQIAKLVIKGDTEASWQLLTEQTQAELSHIHDADLERYISSITDTYYKQVFASETISEAFEYFSKFRILAPTRSGEYGLENLNQMIEQRLKKLGCITTDNALYVGRPIMISQNHYGVNLFNGDIGMLWPNEDGRLVAFFPQQQGFKQVSISRLPAFDTVYAMTIHKTQGSEFDTVSLVLPTSGGERLLSRELIYTGVTRAKKHLQIFCQFSVWKQGVSQKVSRASGLTKRMNSSER